MRKLTTVEKNTLLDLLREASERGDYYGNKEHYHNRLLRLYVWVQGLVTTK